MINNYFVFIIYICYGKVKSYFISPLFKVTFYHSTQQEQKR